MSVQQRGGPNLSFAGVILLAFPGTFALKDAPLDSARPVGNGEWLDLPNDQALPANSISLRLPVLTSTVTAMPGVRLTSFVRVLFPGPERPTIPTTSPTPMSSDTARRISGPSGR